MDKFKKNINTIGKVCRILSLIAMIAMIVATSAIVLGGTVLALLPQDLVQADVNAQADVTLSGSVVGELSSEAAGKIADAVNSKALSFNFENDKSVATDEKSLVVNTKSDTMHFSLRRIGLAILPIALITGSLIAVFYMLGKLMEQLENCASPFTDGVVRAMNGFAISLIPFAVIKTVASSVTSAILLSGKTDLHFGADLTVIFVVLVIVLLSAIFRYGAQLQKESDETL